MFLRTAFKAKLGLNRPFKGFSPAASIRHFSSELDDIERESLDYDVLIVGGGPAGLATAIRLKQLANEAEKELEVCLIEKGSHIGAHILSGNVFEPRAFNELFPDWEKEEDEEMRAPLTQKVTSDKLMILTG